MSQSDNRPSELPGAFSLFNPSMKAISINIITLIELVLIPVLVVTLGELVKHAGGRAITSVGEIMSLLLAPAAYITQLRSAQTKTIDFTEAIKESLHYFWRMVGLGIVLVIIIGSGFILLIVPGLFLLRRYILSPFYLIDQDMKVFDAMRASAADSKTFSMAIWGLIGVQALLALVSAILSILLGPLSIIGLLLYYIYYCAPAIRYLQIKHAVKPKTAAAPIV